jgi:hypothetical protein
MFATLDNVRGGFFAGLGMSQDEDCSSEGIVLKKVTTQSAVY